MAQTERNIYTDQPLAHVWLYLIDFRHTAHWNTATTASERVEGSGAVGSRYRSTLRFAGRDQRVAWSLDAVEAQHRLVFSGTAGRVRLRETYELTDLGAEVRVRWLVRWGATGAAAALSPLLVRPLRRTAEDSALRLAATLSRPR
ncbi:SRPBCC family protein [Nocardioides sp. 1609]|uniref:SRPBCC family protein n=1 Tax=Nocardioides sp. 1609 TaxID=2508327 RepID=UPI00106FEDB0|nr:SRPBCC family protein [Nocardioides sp. 1609]